MLAITAEQLVGAHPGQDDLHAACPGCLAHEQRVDRRRVADGLVEDVDHARQQIDDVRRDLDLVEIDAVAGRHLPGIDGVVRRRLQPLILRSERDRVGIDRGICLDEQAR